MKNILFTLALLVCFNSFGQNFNEYDSKTCNFSYPKEYSLSERRLSKNKFEIKLLSNATDINGEPVTTFTMNSVESNNQIQKTFYDDNHYKDELKSRKSEFENTYPNGSYNFSFERIKMYEKDFIKITHQLSISATINIHLVNFVFIDNNRISTSTIGTNSKKNSDKAIKDLSIIYSSIFHK